MTSTTVKARTVILGMLLVLGTLVMAAPPQGEEQGNPLPGWPSEGDWINYTVGGEPVRDYEDKPYENDPTHGIANVQPKAVDIASGVDASGGGAENNPGNYTSVQYSYLDANDDSNGTENVEDDWMFFRLRIADDPRHGGKYAYMAYHWDVLIEVDYDEWKEFVIDLNGGGGAYKFGTIGVFYTTSDSHEYDPDDDWVWRAEASGNSNDYTNPVEIDYDPGDPDDNQWWIEYRIPVAAFKDHDGNQLVGEDTYFQLFFSTSASATNPLQKDWMGEFVFGQPPHIVVEKEAAEEIVSPGDIIHYTIYYNNTGDFPSKYVWVNDTMPADTTFLSCSPDYDSLDGNIIKWFFEEVMPGNHSLLLNVTVNEDVGDGEILTNWVFLNYTDSSGNDVNETWDSVDTLVTGPTMEFSKSASLEYADPGDTITYTLTYSNTGAGFATDVTVTDTLPPEVTFVSSTPMYDDLDGYTYTWNVGTVSGYTTGNVVIEVTVDAYTTDETLLVNYGTLDFDDINGNPQDGLDDYANVTVNAPVMTLSKVADVSVADPGDTITYTIAYENTGTGQATGVTIIDTIPSATTFQSATPAPDRQIDDVLTWTIGNVDGGASGTITITVTVDAYTPDETVLTNTVTLDYNDANGNAYDQLTDDAIVTCTAPQMSVSKDADVEYANPGDTIMYTITYTNSGTGNANNVVITDTIPAETTFVDSTPVYSTVDGDTYTWNIGSVAGGTTGYIFVNVTVDAGTPDQTVLSNFVVLTYDDENDNEQDEEDDDEDVVVTAPVMTVTKTADTTTANPGDNIVYTLTYTNTGTGDATDVVIEDTIPDYTTFISSAPGYTSVSGGVYTWEIGTVAGGASGTITITVQVDVGTPDGTVLTNTVVLSYDDANDNPQPDEDDSVDVTVTAPIMTFSKTANVTVADPGDTIIYTLSYENTGTGDATDVTITDSIPADTTYVSSTPGYSSVSSDTYTWELGTVSGGGSGTITITVTVDAGTADTTVLHNTATLDYDDTNDNPYDQLDDYADVTCTAPVMTFSKTADVSAADPGDTIVYTLDYENAGTGDATGVTIIDTIPSDTTFVSSIPSPDSSSGDIYTWNIGTVTAGASGSVTITVTVDVGVADGTLLHNTATFDYDDDNGNPYDQLDDYADVTVTAPVMTFSKTADVIDADPGDSVVYSLDYENTGTGDATDITITDTIPADTTFVSSTPSPDSSSGDTYTWNIGTVAAGASGSVTITVTVDVGVADGTLLHNTATFDYDDDNGNPYDQLDDYADVTVTAPVMTFSKTADVSDADPGDTIEYTLDYENTGTGDATDVTITDTIPADTTFVSSTPSPDSSSGDTYTWNIGTVAAGASGSVTITVTVDVAVADGTLLHNTATFDYDDDNGNPYDQLDDYADVTVTAPVMTFSKTADVSNADPGDTIVYTLDYENTGTGDATGVTVVDTIPADTTFVISIPSPSNVNGDIYTWNVGTVAAGASGSITITVTVDVSVADGTLLHNTATFDYDDDNGNPYDQLDDYADVTVTAPQITFSKSADVSFADPSDTIVYTLDYENTGTGDATGVTIIDTIPSDTTFVSSTPSPTSSSGDIYTWNIGTVAAGASGSVTITVTVDVGVADGTLLHNTVTFDHDDDNGNPYTQLDDYADVTVTAPVLTFSKTADVSNVDPSDTIVYTLDYENTGTGDATGVTITDTIPADTTFVSSAPSPSSSSGDTYTWNIGTVAAGASGSVTITVTVDVGVADGTLLHNTATFDYDDANGNPYTQLTDFADVTVTAPQMTFSKTADVTNADPGDTIEYTLAYENTGTGDATDVTITDTLPADTTFVSATPSPDSSSGDTYTWNLGTVTAGASGSVVITVTVDVGVADGTLLHNTATLDYDDAGGNPYTQLTGCDDVTVTAPVMTFSKSSGVSNADPSDAIVYTLDYENTGSGDATDVTITDTIPGDTSFISSTPSPDSSSGDTYTWNIGALAAGASGSVTITVTVDVGVADGTLLHNTATFDYDDMNGNPYTQLTDYADVSVTAPVMSFSKRADVSNADPSDTIVYTLDYENTGTGDATGVTITDTIPADTTFVSSTPSPDSSSSDTYTWNIGTVAAGASASITVTVTVDVGVQDGTLLHNTATFDFDDANGNPYTQLDDYADVTVTAPVMTFSKTADVSNADPSDTIVYTLDYENTGTGDATGVTITDTIPADTTVIDTDPPHDSVSGDTYTWNIGALAAGASGTITITVTVDVGVADGTLLHNTATFDYDDANGNPYTQLTGYADVTVTAPVMIFSKTADVSNADPSDTIVYSLDYENTGSGDATGVTITDTIPADTTFVSSTPSPDSSSSDTYTWNIGSVAAGASGTITITVTVDIGVADGTLLHNTATLDYDDTNGNPYTQLTDCADVTVTAPVMTFSKTAEVSNADPGDTVVYSLDYENTGSGDATGVTITDTIPADTTFVSSTPSPDSSSGDTYTWNIGTVAAGASGSITITVTVDVGVADGTLLHNTATFDYDDANGNPYTQLTGYADVTVTAPVMTFSKTVDVTTADPSDTVVYTLDYENTGSGDATDVTITDTIPADTTFVSSIPSPDSSSGNTYTWNIGTVAAGASGSITVTVTVDVGVQDGTLLHNTATFDYDDDNGNPYTQLTGDADVTVTAPVMTVVKSANVATADPGDYITYTINYENSGSGEATDVVIKDTIPPETTFVSSIPSPDSQSGDTYTWNFASISGYTSDSIIIEVQVDAYTQDGTVLTNTATLDYDDANGNPYTQESDSAEVTVTAPVMTITKVADLTVADPGDSIEYTLTYSNTGSGDATDVTITDTIPADTTFVSSTPSPDSSSGDRYTWNLVTVAAGASASITITVTVDVGTGDGTLLHNSATLDYDDANGNPYPQKTDYADVTVTAPVMSISKTASVTTADPDDEITYEIIFENTGSGDATDVWINDTIPAATSLVSTTPGYDSVSGDTYTWFYSLVGAGTTITITIVVEVDVGTPDQTLLHNSVTLESSDDNGNPLGQETAFADVTVTAPVLTFTKTASVTEADPDDTIVYSLYYENTGTGWASLVEIVDTIPADTTFVSSTPSPSSSTGDEYTWSIGDLAPGASATITITVTVDVGTSDESLLHNVGTLDYADANGNFYTQLEDYADVTVTAPILSITKTASVSTADPDDTIVYTIDYDNSGTGWATLVEIVDTIPADTTFVSSIPSPSSSSGNEYTWTIGDLGPGASGSIEITVTVDVGTPDETLLHNVGTLDYADANGNYYTQLSDYADVILTAPILSITKTASASEADPGDTIDYTITYENSGTGWATLVKIEDAIPAATTYVKSIPTYDSASGDTYTWNLGDLAPGGSGTIILQVTVDVGTPDETLLHNVATLDYADANGNFYTQLEDYADVTVTAPILSVTKTANVTTADPDDTIVYTIEYENSGTGWATLVEIVDTIPGDTTFVSSTPSPTSSSGDEHTWTIGDLGPGASGSIEITVTVDVGTPDETLLHNVATLDYADANSNDYTQLEDYADVTVTAPILSITKTASVTTADPDDTIVYTISYENSGTGWATLVEIVDTIPADTTFVSSTPSPTSSSGEEYTWTIGDLGPGASGSIEITVTVDVGTPDETLLHNTVTLDYADANGNNYAQLEDYADVTVTAPILSITKTASVSNADPDDTIVYTITYENSGTGWATLVEIIDTIPGDTTFVSSTPSPTSSSGDEYTWTIGDLGPGASGSIEITVTVDVGTPDETILHNVATLDYADANGNFNTQLEDHADVTVTAPILSITKTASVSTADPDDTIVYTITYENSGTGWATFVEIADTIPGDTTFVSSTPSPSSSSGDEYTWTIGDLGPGASGSIEIMVTVDVGTSDETILHNVATLDYADANGNYYTQLEDHADVTVTAPELSFTKTADQATADPGDTLVYTLSYENSGTGWATQVEIVDTIPADTTSVSTTPNPTSSSGNEYTWTIGDLGPGASGAIEITVTVNAFLPDETLLHNVATLDHADANGNYYTQLQDYANVLVTAPVMTFSKVADMDYADPGTTITYTLTYTNLGTGYAHNVIIEDTIPSDTTYEDSDPSPTSQSGDTYTWEIGVVPPGTTSHITLNVTVDVGTPDQTLLHNVATLDYSDPNDNYYTQLEDYADVTVTAPIMSLEKTASVTTADPDDTIVYTISYENSGTGWATLVEVVDTIPADTTFVSSTPSPTSSSGDEYTWVIGDLAPGASGTIEITVTVDVGTPDQTLLHNVATLDYADANGNYYTQLEDYADVIVTAPVLSLTKNVNMSEADPGDTLVYTITYENSGTGWATLVEVVDTIPADTTFVSSTPSPTSSSGDEYTWTIGDLGPGTSGTIEITVTVDVGTPDQTVLHNVATLDYADANGNYYTQLEASADVTVTAPVLSMTKSADVSDADPGDPIVYTIYYENSGTGMATLVTIIDTIPADTTFVNSTPAYDSATGDVYTWNIGDVAPGTSGTIEITVTVDVGTPDQTLLHNVATLDYADANSNFYAQLEDYTDVIVTAPVLSLNKTADVADADPGDPIVYTITYENSGTGWASLVEVIDTIPADSTFVSSTPAPTSSSGDAYTWTIGDLAPGASGTIEITVTVDVGTADQTLLHNVATLDYADANGNYYTQLEDYADVVVTAPVMTLSKEAGNVTVDAYILADFRLRIAGEKWHDVTLTLYNDNVSVAVASVTRYPGDPDDQSVTIHNVTINLLDDSFSAVIVYTPFDDPINGEFWGADPCWLILSFPGSTKEVRLHHTFNVRHNDTWIWTIDDFLPYLKNAPITYEAFIPYTIFYENIGTGDATNVVVTDTFPAGSTLIDTDPPHDSVSGDTYTWNIGDVAAGGSGYIFANISYIFEIDGTVITNEVTLDYADANGNFIEQLYDTADSALNWPLVGFSSTIPPIPGIPGSGLSAGYTVRMTAGTSISELSFLGGTFMMNPLYSPSGVSTQTSGEGIAAHTVVIIEPEVPEITGEDAVIETVVVHTHSLATMHLDIDMDARAFEPGPFNPANDADGPMETVESVDVTEDNIIFEDVQQDIMDEEQATAEVIQTEEQVKSAALHRIEISEQSQSPYQPQVMTSDSRDTGLAVAPSAEMVSTSLSIAYTVLLFALAALAVGLYIFNRPEIKKRS